MMSMHVAFRYMTEEAEQARQLMATTFQGLALFGTGAASRVGTMRLGRWWRSGE